MMIELAQENICFCTKNFLIGYLNKKLLTGTAKCRPNSRANCEITKGKKSSFKSNFIGKKLYP